MLNHLTRLGRKTRDTYAYWRLLSSPESAKRYTVSKLSDDDLDGIDEAKKLHAAVYISKGFISPEDIAYGTIHTRSDPYQEHSDYFVVKRRNKVVGVARQIIYKGEGDHHESFPVLKESRIHDRSKMRIINMYPYEIVEISALVKKSGESSIIPLLLYRALWQNSLNSQHRLWVMACDVRLYERLKVLFGPTLRRIGQRTPYQGGDVIPVALSIPEAVKYVDSIKHSHKAGISAIIQQKAAKFIIGKDY